MEEGALEKKRVENEGNKFECQVAKLTETSRSFAWS
jgi:hypothetical protein